MGSALSSFSAALSSFRHPAAGSAVGDELAPLAALAAAAWSALASPQQNAASSLAGTVEDHVASILCPGPARALPCHRIAKRPRLASEPAGLLVPFRGQYYCSDGVEMPADSTSTANSPGKGLFFRLFPRVCNEVLCSQGVDLHSSSPITQPQDQAWPGSG